MPDKTVTLTASEAASLLDFLDCNLIKVIRDDTEIDNIEWLVNMCHVYEKCKANEKTSGGTNLFAGIIQNT